MRYERSIGARTVSLPFLSPRTRLAIVSGLLAVVGVIIYLVSSGASDYAKVTGPPKDVRATERSFIAANVLIENLGAPAPKQTSVYSFILRSHPISPDHRGVEAESYPWIGATGRIVRLSAVSASRLVLAQAAVISQFFAGQAKSDVISELDQIVGGETRVNPTISGPGGASIVKWLRVKVNGNTAQLEADVNIWESVPSLDRASGTPHLSSSLNANQVDASATLERRGNRWLVTSFNQAPWQEAT